MRALVIGTMLALALGACGERGARQADAGEGCARSATRQVDFTAAEAPETVTARADGPTCAQAFVVLTLRDAAGAPLWIAANTHYDLAGGGIPPEDAPPVTNEAMDQFLASWADVSMLRSGALPGWAEDAATPGDESTQGMAYYSDLPRESYEMLRERNLPMLCYAAAAEASHCIVMDPLSNAPIMLVGFGA